eukprot:gene1152-2366_t
MAPPAVWALSAPLLRAGSAATSRSWDDSQCERRSLSERVSAVPKGPKRKVLVTGAAGFIGSHVAEYTSKVLGFETVGVDDLSGGFLRNVPDGVTFVDVDLKEPHDVAALFKTHGPFDYVYHLAAYAAEGDPVWHPSEEECAIAFFESRPGAARMLATLPSAALGPDHYINVVGDGNFGDVNLRCTWAEPPVIHEDAGPEGDGMMWQPSDNKVAGKHPKPDVRSGAEREPAADKGGGANAAPPAPADERTRANSTPAHHGHGFTLQRPYEPEALDLVPLEIFDYDRAFERNREVEWKVLLYDLGVNRWETSMGFLLDNYPLRFERAWGWEQNPALYPSVPKKYTKNVTVYRATAAAEWGPAPACSEEVSRKGEAHLGAPDSPCTQFDFPAFLKATAKAHDFVV